MSKTQIFKPFMNWSKIAFLAAGIFANSGALASEVPTAPISTGDSSIVWILAPSLNSWINAVNTIYCHDETPTLKVYDNDGDCPEIAECVKVHENTHLEDALLNNPKVCNGNIGDTIIGVSDTSKRLASETRAYQNELQCLASEFKRVQNIDCRSKINIQMIVINEYTLPKVKAGNYP